MWLGLSAMCLSLSVAVSCMALLCRVSLRGRKFIPVQKEKAFEHLRLDKEKDSCLNRGAKLPSGLLCIVDIARPRGRLVLEPSATLATLQQRIGIQVLSSIYRWFLVIRWSLGLSRATVVAWQGYRTEVQHPVARRVIVFRG